MAASRASIKRAVLAARLLRKTEESADPKNPEDSKPVGVAAGAAGAEGFRGGSVASKIRIQKQLTRRSSSGRGTCTCRDVLMGEAAFQVDSRRRNLEASTPHDSTPLVLDLAQP